MIREMQDSLLYLLRGIQRRKDPIPLKAKDFLGHVMHGYHESGTDLIKKWMKKVSQTDGWKASRPFTQKILHAYIYMMIASMARRRGHSQGRPRYHQDERWITRVLKIREQIARLSEWLTDWLTGGRAKTPERRGGTVNLGLGQIIKKVQGRLLQPLPSALDILRWVSHCHCSVSGKNGVET